MWGSLLALAFLLTINPLRVGIMLLVLSRPRAMQNLLAYWVGILFSGLFYLVVPLAILHSTPAFSKVAETFMHSEPNPVVQRALVGVGVALLLLAALLASRSRVPAPQTRRRTDQSPPGGTSTTTLDPATLPIISRLVRPTPEDAPASQSWTRRLVGRGREAWQSGSPWLAFTIGLMVMPADGVLLAFALIVTSGAAVGMQFAAAALFVVLVLSVEEIILISNLLVPDKTRAALQRLHEWAVAHHRKFMAAIVALVGASLVLQGMGGL